MTSLATADWFWPVLLAPFIGSFLGVLVMRLPHGRAVLWDRSVCEQCGATLVLTDAALLAVTDGTFGSRL